MLLDVAKARVRLKCQTSVAPQLSDQEITDLLAVYALQDTNGLGPTEVGWVGTWDLTEVYRQGWLLKAAKAVAEVSYQADGAQYSQSDLYAHCIEQSNKFGSIGSISVGVA